MAAPAVRSQAAAVPDSASAARAAARTAAATRIGTALRRVRQLQDCSIALQFEPQLHPYIYPAGSSGGQRAPRWAVHSLRYPADTGRAHAYFQDLNDP
ncbi:hypothetical protein JTP77_040910, partial [Streptomyces sp. S9]|nr:hypothetical protein [Streptomyces sp. S9]